MNDIDLHSAAAAWTAAALRDLQHTATRHEARFAARERLARHTTMGIGGCCPMMLWPRRPEAVRELARFMGARGLGWRMLGGGSNLLVGDDGVAEVVINCCRLLEGEEIGEEQAFFPAGTPTARALRSTVEHDRDGLVWTAGLPGTIGGAAAGNAGCWGGDMATSVTTLDVVTADGQAVRLTAEELDWRYRDLRLPTALAAPVAIVGVGVGVRPADGEALRARYQELQETKRQRQPIGARNSGCIFRNPAGNASAGQLIDQAGGKELSVGAAHVSKLHANFIVNRGGAAATDVLALIEKLHARVLTELGVELQTEIRRW